MKIDYEKNTGSEIMSDINPNEILSDITVHMKYAKYNPDLQRS